MVVRRLFFEATGSSPGVHQHEAAGAVGVFDHAGLEAVLAEGGRLLVARVARQRESDGRTTPRRSRRRLRWTAGPRAASRGARRAAAAVRRPSASVWMLNSSVRLALL